MERARLIALQEELNGALDRFWWAVRDRAKKNPLPPKRMSVIPRFIGFVKKIWFSLRKLLGKLK